MDIPWPSSVVWAVRHLKSLFSLVSHHRVLGVPLDLPLRFFGLAGLLMVLRRWVSTRSAVIVCTLILLTKELFDILAVQVLSHPKRPHADDLTDIASGLAGIALGVLLARVIHRTGRRPLADIAARGHGDRRNGAE